MTRWSRPHIIVTEDVHDPADFQTYGRAAKAMADGTATVPRSTPAPRSREARTARRPSSWVQIERRGESLVQPELYLKAAPMRQASADRAVAIVRAL